MDDAETDTYQQLTSTSMEESQSKGLVYIQDRIILYGIMKEIYPAG